MLSSEKSASKTMNFGWVAGALLAASIEPIIVKFGYRGSVTPLHLFVVKNLFACLCLLPLLATGYGVMAANWRQLLIVSSLLFMTNLFTLYALKSLSAVAVITVVSTVPALVAIVNQKLGRDHLEREFWTGFWLCFLGVIFSLDLSSFHANAQGLVAIVIAVITSTVYRIRMEGLTERVSPLICSASSFGICLIASAFLLPLAWPLPHSVWTFGVWIGVAAALANVAFLTALNRVGATRISVFTMLQRPLLIIAAALVLKEPVTLLQTAGIVMVLLGTHLARVRRAQEVAVSVLALMTLSASCPSHAQEETRAAAKRDVINIPTNFVAKNVPPVPRDLAEKALRYTDFRSATLSDFHPRKVQMLIHTRFSETSQIHLVRAPGAARYQLTFFPDRVGGGVFQPPEGEMFVFSKDRDGDEQFQKYSYNLSSRDIAMLTDGRSRNGGGRWSNAGDRIAYTSDRRNKKDSDVYVLSFKTGTACDSELMKLTGEGWSISDWSPDDRTLLLTEYVSANESYLWLLDIAGKEMTCIGANANVRPKATLGQPIKPPKLQVSYQNACFSRDGKTIFCTSDFGGEFKRLASIDLRSGKSEFISTPFANQYDVDDFALSWDGKKMAILTNENAVSGLYLMDLTAGKSCRKVQTGLPQGEISGLTWHRNNEVLGFEFESANSPCDVYCATIGGARTSSSANTASGSGTAASASTASGSNTIGLEVERWTESETGLMDTKAFPQPEHISWQTFDGREIPALLYRPPARFKGPRPVLVVIHGGPEGQSRGGFNGRNNYYLMELGIAVIYPNIRGSTGYGKTFVSLDNGFKREDSYRDIESLFRWIARERGLDPSRVAVMGGSYGGHMALAISTYYPDHIRCAIDIVGPSNLVTFLERTSEYRKDLRRAEYGDERDPEMRAFLEKIAPMNNLDSIKNPLFVVQGEKDPRVPASESQQIVDALEKKKTPVWFLMARDEGHGFSRKKNNDFLFCCMIMFLQKYLLN